MSGTRVLHENTIDTRTVTGDPLTDLANISDEPENETKFIAREIKPNDTALVLLSATLNKAGEYDITVKVTGETRKQGSGSQTVTLNVVKKLKIQPKSKAKTMRTVPATK